MAIFNGRYSWSGKKEADREPIAWFAGAYDLIIKDLSIQSESVYHLKPYLCIFTSTGDGHSVSANPEKFAQHICDDFDLRIDKVLWVEQWRTRPEIFEVIRFVQSGKLGEHIFYRIEKRPPLDNELNLIKKELGSVS